MTLPPEKLADLRLKHLGMIQALIARMAGYGAGFKSYCITVTTAVAGFAVTLQRPGLVFLALFPIITFAVADAQYLRLERRFRGLYDAVRGQDWAMTTDFAIDLTSAPSEPYGRVFLSWSILFFYGTLA